MTAETVIVASLLFVVVACVGVLVAAIRVLRAVDAIDEQIRKRRNPGVLSIDRPLSSKEAEQLKAKWVQHYGATPPAKPTQPPQPTRPDPSAQEKRR